MYRFLQCLLFFVVSASSAMAANISVVSVDSRDYSNSGAPNRLLVIALNGPIEQGDAERLGALLDSHAFQPHFEFDEIVLTLDSPGGSFAEGLRLGDLIKDQIVTTYIGDGSACLSACAIVFMAGTDALVESKYPLRILHPGGRLGFHAPSLHVDRQAQMSGAEVTRAYAIAIRTMSELVDRAELWDLRDSLLVTMTTTSPNDMALVATAGDANRWGIDLDIPQSAAPLSEEDLVVLCLATKDYRNGHRAQLPVVSGGLTSQYPVEHRTYVQWRQEHRLAIVMSSPFSQERCGIRGFEGPRMEIEYTYGDADALLRIFQTKNWVGSLVGRQYALRPEVPLSAIPGLSDTHILKLGCPSHYEYLVPAGRIACRPPE